MFSDQWTINESRNATLHAMLWGEMYKRPDQKQWYPDPRPAVILFPGGGYGFMSEREGWPLGIQLMARGYNVFVLKYSIGAHSAYPNPWVDASRAVRFVRANAERFHIDPSMIAVAGFSAGGHLAAWLATSYDDEELLASERQEVSEAPFYESEAQVGETVSNRPDCVILGYALVENTIVPPGYPPEVVEQAVRQQIGYSPGRLLSDPHPKTTLTPLVTAKHPPAFIWHTGEDELVPAVQSLRYAQALCEAGVPCELHLFAEGPHGLATADHLTCSDGRPTPGNTPVWLDLAEVFLDEHLGGDHSDFGGGHYDRSLSL